MVRKTKEGIAKYLKEEFINTTDTLWENEIAANIYVVQVMLGTAVIDLIFIILASLNIITVERIGILYQSLAELLIPAFLCLHFKGKKKWLKIVLLIEYVIVLARVESVLTHNVVLTIVFPTVLSMRYYSRTVTAFIALFTTLCSGVADYFGVYLGWGRLDLNMLELNQGTTLIMEKTGLLRDAIMSQATIDRARLWSHTLQHSYMPKLILFSMVAIICTEIARRGRMAIFAQQEETRKAERISTELNLASSIQANMLPNIFPAFPNRKDFDIYATMTPAKEVGGDFYDFFMIDDEKLALVIADVSDKGVPAALFMVIAKTLIKDHLSLGLSPAQAMTKVNNILCDGNEDGLFVTAWLGIIDLKNNKLTYTNAGHNPPVIKNGDNFEYLKQKPGFVLAAMEGFKYKETEQPLNKGDSLFLYTDGASEAMNKNKEQYGEDRLLEVLKQQKGKSCEEALKNVYEDIKAFADGAPQSDDLTMLAFHKN